MFNPLLETNVRDRTWYDVAEELDHKVGWAARKGRLPEAFKWLNVIDLIDTEAAAYWRNYGLDFYNGKPVEYARRETSCIVDPGTNPLFD